MISTSSRLSAFISGFDEKNSARGKHLPHWLADARSAGIHRFNQLGFPTPKDEEWKHTSIAPIVERKFHLPTAQKIIEVNAFEGYRSGFDVTIVFVNGFFSKEYSHFGNLSKKCSLVNLAEISERDNENIRPLLDKYASAAEDSFAALNRAFLNNGTVIKIDDKAVVEKPIHIIHIASGIKDNAIIFPRTLIILGKSSEAEILESHVAFCDTSYFVNAVSDIFVAEDAKLRYYKTQGESPKAFHIATTRAWQERNSQFETFSFSTGAEITRNNLTVTLNGEGASAVLNGLYAATGHQLVDNHTAVDHRTPHCTSNQLYKGILDGDARAVFNGKIFVRREAQQTNSYQLNKNLMLGKGCQVNTKPQLEIFADDVRCTHGATIGQLNEDEIFYLLTRAIPKNLAVKMLARGFVDDIFSKVRNETVRGKMDKLLTNAFSVLK